MSARDRASHDATSPRASAARPASRRSTRPVFEARREEDLAAGTATQAAMLCHIEDRLGALRALADAERAAERRPSQRDGWDDAADRQKAAAGWHQPNDARFKPVAQLFEAAAQAAARGDLAQAAQRLNDAAAAEAVVRAETSRHILPEDADRYRTTTHAWTRGVRGATRAAVHVPASIRAAVDDLVGRTPPSVRPWTHAPDRRPKADPDAAAREEEGDAEG